MPTGTLLSFTLLLKVDYDASKKYEERLKEARRTKDPLQLEMADSAAMKRKEFAAEKKNATR